MERRYTKDTECKMDDISNEQWNVETYGEDPRPVVDRNKLIVIVWNYLRRQLLF